MSQEFSGAEDDLKVKEYANLLKSKVPELIDDMIKNPRDSRFFMQGLSKEFFTEFKDQENYRRAKIDCENIIKELHKSHPSKDVLYNLISLDLMMILDVLDGCFGTETTDTDSSQTWTDAQVGDMLYGD